MVLLAVSLWPRSQDSTNGYVRIVAQWNGDSSQGVYHLWQRKGALHWAVHLQNGTSFLPVGSGKCDGLLLDTIASELSSRFNDAQTMASTAQATLMTEIVESSGVVQRWVLADDLPKLAARVAAMPGLHRIASEAAINLKGVWLSALARPSGPMSTSSDTDHDPISRER